MFLKKVLPAAFALALIGFSPLSQAVSLGDMTVESRSGEPLDAVLDIEDLDLTVSPLLVRVAPPATYIREGVDWPAQVQDLKLSRDGAQNRVRLRIRGEQLMKQAGFPLLIELNAGGNVSVRTYTITDDGKGGFTVAAAKARQTVTAPEVKHEPEALPESIAKDIRQQAADASTVAKPLSEPKKPVASEGESRIGIVYVRKPEDNAEKPLKPVKRKGRYAPNVVRDYVALNGFDAAQPFTVQRDMTLWSVGSLYWPSYRGATIEQLLVAFRQKNPSAFQQGDLNRLEVGAVLNPPAAADVFAVDPYEAFRELHGGFETIPAVTRNLIEAQRLNAEAARAVADAQTRAQGTADATEEKIAEAGQRELSRLMSEMPAGTETQAAGETPVTTETAVAGDGAAATTEQTEKTETAELVESAETAPAAESAAETAATAAPTAASTETEAGVADKPAQSVAAESAAEAAPAPAPAPAAATVSASASEAGIAPKAESAAAVPVADKASADGKPSALNGFKMEPWMWAVLGLLALLIVVFAMRRRGEDEEKKDDKPAAPAVVTIQKDVPASTEAQVKAVTATVDSAIVNGTTAGAMGAGAVAFTEARMQEEKAAEAAAQEVAPEAVPGGLPADQEWIDPKDNELPPLHVEEEVSADGNRAMVRKIAAVIRDVSLDLDGEPRKTGGGAAVKTAPKKEDAKEKAEAEALEAKLKLASNFIELGAIDEVRELLDEVERYGSADQRARAAELRKALKK